MTIKEILEIESTNTSRINLFKEGIFWRVYQKSAYFFTKQIKDLKVLKKFYKIVNCEVVYAGFPDTILPKIQEVVQSKRFKFQSHNEKYCSILNFEVDNNFEQWFQSLSLFQKTISVTDGGIIQKIKEYPVFTKTPLETVQFVAEIQERLNKV